MTTDERELRSKLVQLSTARTPVQLAMDIVSLHQSLTDLAKSHGFKLERLTQCKNVRAAVVEQLGRKKATSPIPGRARYGEVREKILKLAKEKGRISTSDLIKAYPGTGAPSTWRAQLSHLAQRGELFLLTPGKAGRAKKGEKTCSAVYGPGDNKA